MQKLDNKVGVILQARMGSSRLPGKVLLPFVDTTILGWIIDRISILPFKLVIATSRFLMDDIIVEYCANKKVDCFRGDEENVLDRFYQCAIKNKFQHVIRLTADNPFTDIEEVMNLTRKHLLESNDYTHSFGQMPVGVGAEVFKFSALEKSLKKSYKQNHFEHANEYILEHPKFFKIGLLNVSKSKFSPGLNLTVDTIDDYYRVCNIAKNQSIKHSSTEDLIYICSQFV